MPRFALLIAYDGTDFSGWWRQPDRRTVAGVLDEACARIGEAKAQAVGASRTDAGVHALGQLAHLDVRRAWDAGRFAAALNRHLPPDATVRAAAAVDAGWHAAHGVRRKTYRYRLDAGAAADPFSARTAWRTARLDPALLAQAAALVPGQRDWAAFVRRGEHRADTSLRVLACRWAQRDGALACDITATGFIYRLARALVGGMVQVGRGAAGVAAWQATVEGAASGLARQQAPAHGLHLLRVVHRQAPAWQAPR
jgi:tRNA pseudouridine38-40 synthase